MTACARCSFDPDASVLAAWAFCVPVEIRSGNSHIVNAAASRWSYKRTRDSWQALLRNMRLLQGMPKATSKRRVTITRHYAGRQRAFDRDNLATGCKVIVDAMVRAGLLVNDDAGNAEIHYAQSKQPEAGTVFCVEVLA